MIKKVEYQIKNLLIFFQGLSASIFLFKNVKVYLCNHITVSLRYIHNMRIKLPHPVGIVIGSKVKIGFDCTIYQNVTIGTKDTDNYLTAQYPTIGNNVTIYANSVVFGGIKIGDNVVIGAGSVVYSDLPDNCVAVGNPARIIKRKHNEI